MPRGIPGSDPIGGRKGHEAAVASLSQAFRQAGWSSELEPSDESTADLRVRRGSNAYVIEVKAGIDGRADWLVPLWAQAHLEAQRAAGTGYLPLAVVTAPAISDRTLRQIVDFAAQNAPGAALGVIDQRGRSYFQGIGLAELGAWEPVSSHGPNHPPSGSSNLFTDINQWLLKVLLGPWIPESLIACPRGVYRNASELAAAAGVSVMSAFRVIDALRAQQHLEEHRGALTVVRRRELLERWRAWSASRTPQELPTVFLIAGNAREELRALLRHDETVLGLFAAADALGLGFVRGVPPHVYVPSLLRASISRLANVAAAGPGEQPSLFLRQSPAPKSIMRGAVRTDEGLVTDVLQTWLDVSSHPGRGSEQADLIEHRALGELLKDA